MARQVKTFQGWQGLSLILQLGISMFLLTVVTVHMSSGAALTDPNRVIYVDAAATGTNDGSSWANAYCYLQDALADANSPQDPVEIRVAQGIYTPDTSSAHPQGTGDRAATFYLLDNVAVKGGYAGAGAPDPNARDTALYKTILSGDLTGDDVAVVDPCDLLTEPTRAENSLSVVTAGPCSRSAVLEGFTIRSGNAKGPSHDSGGGLDLSYLGAPCCPSVRKCVFVHNSGWTAGAVRVVSARPELVDCAFVENAAEQRAGALKTTIWRDDRSGASSMCDFVIRRCVFTNNCAQSEGGAICVGSDPPSVVEHCMFTGNSANNGGAVYCSAETMSVANCCFLYNVASKAGGCIYLSRPALSLTSCTMFGNVAPVGRAIAGPTSSSSACATLTNTILWDGGSEIHTAQINVAYSDIQGGWPGEGNIDADPLFADPNSGDLRLKSQAGRWDPNSLMWIADDVTSPCIDAGDPNSSVGDEPQPNGGRINIGVYGGTAEASKSPSSDG